jgi:hypothetical protein
VSTRDCPNNCLRVYTLSVVVSDVRVFLDNGLGTVLRLRIYALFPIFFCLYHFLSSPFTISYRFESRSSSFAYVVSPVTLPVPFVPFYCLRCGVTARVHPVRFADLIFCTTILSSTCFVSSLTLPFLLATDQRIFKVPTLFVSLPRPSRSRYYQLDDAQYIQNFTNHLSVSTQIVHTVTT